MLEIYQTDKPMILCIGNGLGLLIKSIWQKVIKSDVMNAAITSGSVSHLEIKKIENHVKASKVEI